MISWGSFVRTKHLFVLIHILIHIGNKGEVGAIKNFKPSSILLFVCSKAVLLLLILFVNCVLYLSVEQSCLFLTALWSVTCWERTDLLALLYVVFSCVFVSFPYGALGQVWYLIVIIHYICLQPYFVIYTLP